MKTKTLFIILGVLIIYNIFPEIKYRISGKIIYNGQGVDNIRVVCHKFGTSRKNKSEYFTNEDGSFHFYVPDGIYQITPTRLKGYVCKNEDNIITVDKKNISNINIFLEKDCKISGEARFSDGTPIVGATVFVKNNKSSSSGFVGPDGRYIVDEIAASDNTDLILRVFGMKPNIIKNLSLQEGIELENINFIIEKKLSLNGKIIDKDSKKPINDVYIIISDGIDQFDSISDEVGNFKLYNLKKAKYTIVFIHEFYKEEYVEILFNDNQVQNKTFEITKLSEEELKDKYPYLDKKKKK